MKVIIHEVDQERKPA